MKVVYSEKTLLHDPKVEVRDEYVQAAECPERVVNILDELEKHRQIVEPDPSIDYDAIIRTIHKEDYLQYLQTIYEKWKSEGGRSYISHWDKKYVSEDLMECVKTYSDISTCITDKTFESAYASAQCAITGAKLLTQCDRNSYHNKQVFALCRPPGHHCDSGKAAGFCYMNNAALATTYLKSALSSDKDAHIAILDLDFHHGNGTQNIFYDQKNPAYVSIHTQYGYPGTGAENETGEGDGEGYTRNFHLPFDTKDEEYLRTLERAVSVIRDYGSTHLVVSFGVDTYKDDPVGVFLLTSEAYFEMGKMISQLDIPVLVIMEGGYHLPTIGRNVDFFLTGLEGM